MECGERGPLRPLPHEAVEREGEHTRRMAGGQRDILLQSRPSLGVERAAGIAVDEHVAGGQLLEVATDGVWLPCPKAIATAVPPHGVGMLLPVIGPKPPLIDGLD